jgi:2'-5' RNA ligase
MNTSAARAPEATEMGWFALVTYLPDPLSAFLSELRQMLPGDNRAEAHVTLLPPRALTVPIHAALADIRHKLSGVTPFELELGEVSVFPETNILYLSLQSGHDVVLTLHSALNHGSLFAQEHFDFVPHLTIGGPISLAEVASVCEKASLLWEAQTFSRRFWVHAAVLLWQPGSCSDNNWSRVSSVPLLIRT